ncbi:HIT-like protein [Lojkania enalia]|uniref:Aprataxin-like protein n=1 Tax=Lojkania enalia TaxID=147567 RepID=A0A9P4JWK9_9PLEO|nr:HIT-like protein [Didymosphaeria enalia]
MATTARKAPIAADDIPNEGQEARDVNPKPEKRRNAFTELMTSKKPKTIPPETQSLDPPSAISTPTWRSLKRNPYDPRDGLGEYIEHPEKNPGGRVIQYDDEFVVIKDKYPKSSVHLLLIPRDLTLSRTHPLTALSTNPTLLSSIRQRVTSLKALVASELRRQYGRYSAADAPYQAALEALMSSDDPPAPENCAALLPPGRDWSREVVAGVHTHPSMNDLHIHIFSRDLHSECLKHKKHYLSFTTSFLVQIDELPLEDKSPRYHAGDWPSRDMHCWRCGRNFTNKFKALKEHLENEFEEWKRE